MLASPSVSSIFGLGLMLGLTVCCPGALAQVEQQLAQQLVGHTVVLRNFYTGEKLKYGPNGALIAGGTAGSGPADGRVYVEAVELEKNNLIIRGERPISVFNPATGETSLLGLHEKVEIEAELPSDKTASEATTELLHRLFLTSAETNLLSCSADEEKTFRARMLRAKDFVSVPQDGKQNTKQPRQLCFPDGDRAYVAGDGVKSPKALKTPEPPYPPGELAFKPPRQLGRCFPAFKQENRVVLSLIIDSKGVPTSLVLIGAAASLTPFDQAVIKRVQGWKFKPATYQGKPVPAAIMAEVNFRLRQECDARSCGEDCIGDSDEPVTTVRTTLNTQ